VMFSQAQLRLHADCLLFNVHTTSRSDFGVARATSNEQIRRPPLASNSQVVLRT